MTKHKMKCILSLIATLLLTTHEFAYAHKFAIGKKARLADKYFEQSEFLKAYTVYNEIILADTGKLRNYIRNGEILSAKENRHFLNMKFFPLLMSITD